MQIFTDTARAFAVHLHSNGLIETFVMIEQGAVAKITTHTGHVIALSTGIFEGDEVATYSVYGPGDTDMIDGPITTDGFEITSVAQADTYLAEIAAQY